MSTTPTTTFETASTLAPSQHHRVSFGGHQHHSGKRIRHFLHPDGKKVHVAASPSDIEILRKTVSAIEKEGDFELVIHGSAEHVEALRDAHAYHEGRRNALREKHSDLFEELESVIRNMDSLSNELHTISEHAVQLDASFSKYGYSAHLRTHNSSPNSSSANSLYDEHDDDDEHGPRDWDAERKKGRMMKFFVKPIVRQYFHKGLLWRAQETQEVAWYELFVDLLYVGIIAVAGDSAVEEATGESLLRFAITFNMGWKIWTDVSLMVNWFDADDVVRRLSILFTLACLLAFTTSISECFSTTWTPLVACYLAARLFTAASFAGAAYLIPMVRMTMVGQMLAALVPAALWIGSIHVESVARRQPLIWVAIVFDIFGVGLTMLLQRSMEKFPTDQLRGWARKSFEFHPGVNLEHRIERSGAFFILVLGYSVVGLMYQSRATATQNFNDFLGKASLGLVQAFSLGWMYFEVDSWNLHTHAIRRHFVTSFLWVSSHVPLVMAYAISGAALSRILLAHDTSRSSMETLSETYMARSELEVSRGQRWFYCTGLGIALACMGILSASNEHRTIATARLRKRHRLALRFAVSIVLMLLPLGPAKSLTSLKLIATTTSLIFLVLAVDLYGVSCSQAGFWFCRESFSDEGARKCKYMARCRGVSKRDLEASVIKGQVLNVEEVAEREQERAMRMGRVQGRPCLASCM
ncbi:hypothetical protein EV356DRAFT_453607 [Viridothelium virens]|uniref:Uncharacterized protein n=1 Tax=Viridothelium virens TaxID=1048519 RepID=A0A6A6GXW2_VIRVR|nr:hypothetical protein EV356DRAFT_453607 [Viridothelium virens]